MSNVSLFDEITLKAETYLKQFTECIRESKRPIGMFFGAGCAKSLPGKDGDPLVPDTKGMTEEVRDRVLENGLTECWETVIDRIEVREDETPNIEDVLSQVRGLRRYAGEGGVKGIEIAELEQLESEICECIIELVDVELPDGSSGYRDFASWLGSIEREEPVEIFTTNYDLLIEQALERRNIPYFDGFVGGNKPFFDQYSVTNDDLPARWIRLWKIHGSMNWTSSKENGSIRIWRTDNVDDERAVIHPSHMKYNQSRKMPYLTLIDRLKQFLKKEKSVLFIVGYSFGDEHLNDVLMQSLRQTPSSAVFAFMYGNLGEYDEVQQFAKRQSNFSLFARDAGVIGTKTLHWTTREADSKPENNIAGIDFYQEEKSAWKERIVLGDFEEFGKFFRSVIGPEAE